MNIKKMLENIKIELRPDSNSSKEAKKFLDTLNKGLKAEKIDAKAELGGSLAKGTNLKNQYDADIFVRFSNKYADKNISEPLKKLLKKLKVKFEEVHGSRDYFQIKNEITYEIVPVMYVETYKDAKNVVDMSPLHVKYFEQKVKDEQTRDDIRLTKQFMKSAKAYGAESYIQGFSGHVVDLLIIKYGSFQELIKAAAKWKNKTIIDIEKYHKFPEMSLNASKIQGPLIIVDPVQKNRNAAAAVSQESYDKFKKNAKDFLKKPSEEFFKIKNIQEEIDENKNKKGRLCVLEVTPLTGKKDVIGSKVLKIKEYLDEQLTKNDFKTIWTEWDFNEKKSTLAWLIKNEKLSETIILEGPTTDMKEHIQEFKKKHKNTKTSKERIYAEEKRRYFDPKELLKDFIEKKYVQERCKKISLAKL